MPQLVLCRLWAMALLPCLLAAAEPLPEKAKIEAAQRLVRDTYRDELTSEAGLRKVLDAAGGLTEAPDQAAAYLVVASSATSNGWLKIAFDAVDRLARRFDYDALAAKVSMLDGAVKRAKTADDRVSIVNRALELLDEATESERFDAGDDALKVAAQVVGKLKDAELRKELANKRKAFDKLKRGGEAEEKALNAARDKLKQEPSNPAANETMGRHLVIRGDWQSAPVRLAKAADDDLRAAATTDLMAQKDPSKQMLAADAWWNVADSAKGKEQRAYRARAVYWYSFALPSLTGLLRTRAEKRIEEAGKVDDDVLVSAGRQVDVSLGSATIRMVQIPASADGKIKTFWLSQTEITQAQWSAIMGTNPSSEKGESHPVCDVAVADAREFVKKLDVRGRFAFRLPTGEEWLHAYTLDTAGKSIDSIAWHKGNSTTANHQVATKAPGNLGLYDMAGNVLEHTSDAAHLYGGSIAILLKPGPAFVEDSREGNKHQSYGFRVAADLR